MKIIFFGTSDFSKTIFEALVKNGYSPILWGKDKNFEEFKSLKPDFCVVVAYGRIIPKEWLAIPKYGFLNIHPSLLPKYRGPSPIQTAILNGDKETGVTIILMDEKIDHGPIVKIQNLKIKNQNYKELERELAELGGRLLIEVLPDWVSGQIKLKEQNHEEATYTKKFSWLDGKINWNKPAEEIDRQIRALNPEPGTWTMWNPSTGSSRAGKILKILEAKIYEKQTYHEHDEIYIGVVYAAEGENDHVFIPCSRGHIEPLIVQVEGKKSLSIKDFLNGHRDFIGLTLS